MLFHNIFHVANIVQIELRERERVRERNKRGAYVTSMANQILLHPWHGHKLEFRHITIELYRFVEFSVIKKKGKDPRKAI